MVYLFERKKVAIIYAIQKNLSHSILDVGLIGKTDHEGILSGG